MKASSRGVLGTVGGTSGTTRWLPLQFQGTFDGVDVYVLNETVRMFVAPAFGLNVTVDFRRNSTVGEMTAQASIAGTTDP